ncbi:DinB family protein [Nocardia sp. NPDC059180]|uniref:DinB family protein n=1 Tax=Nocardia sp. NPDC059180 TaxID=3346761 RepID=UPI00368FAFD8
MTAGVTSDRIEGVMPDSAIDRSALAVDLERARADFHELVAGMGDDEWDRPSSGTRWTNEQLLFHMVFGYMVVRRLLILVRIFGRLPDGVGRAFARLLDFVTTPFHLINYYGSCMATRVYNRRRMAAQLDRVIASLQRSLAREDDADLRRGMHYPTRWDPYFLDYMTLADIYRYPGRHYDHHRRQLSMQQL